MILSLYVLGHHTVELEQCRTEKVKTAKTIYTPQRLAWNKSFSLDIYFMSYFSQYILVSIKIRQIP